MVISIYEARAEVLKAMAHPARLKIIDSLANGEKCVYALQKIVGFKLSTVSRHLSRMKSAGIIAGRREKNQIYYKLLVPCIMHAFDCVDNVIRSNGKRKAVLCNFK